MIRKTSLRPLFLLLSIHSQWLVQTTAPVLVVAFSPPIAAAHSHNRRRPQQQQNSNELSSKIFRSQCVSALSRLLAAVASASQATEPPTSSKQQFKHIMAILAVPYTSIDRIANEAILETAIAKTNKLSVVLRCEGARTTPSLASLRRHISEIYSQLWDLVMDEFPERGVPDVVVYPQNMPNLAPESWVEIQPDLDCVCTHDSLCGWVSEEATGRGLKYLSQQGRGGLKEHVRALNAERKRRKLGSLVALPPNHWPLGAQVETERDSKVIFLDDEPNVKSSLLQALDMVSACAEDFGDDNECIIENEGEEHNEVVSSASFLGGAPVSSNDLFESVAVGGTFDGLHIGHRKLLTLAISSVQPMTGRLLVGITVDEMLRSKTCASEILPYKDREATIYQFLKRLAPGCLNRIKLVPITDKFGPPAQPDMFFDALVLSHEVLDTGYQLNQHRASIGLEPLYLLCTRRTEARGMSSTALRKARVKQHQANNKRVAAEEK